MAKVKTKIDWTELSTFTRKGKRPPDPFIRLSANGTFTLSAGFLDLAKKELEGQTHVLLSYLPKQRIVVFEFISDSSIEGVLKLTMGAHNYSISGKSFFNNYGLNHGEFVGKYDPECHKAPKKGNCWVIFLDKKK